MRRPSAGLGDGSAHVFLRDVRKNVADEPHQVMPDVWVGEADLQSRVPFRDVYPRGTVHSSAVAFDPEHVEPSWGDRGIAIL